MTQTSLSPRAWTELALLALIWGASFLSIRLALFEIGPAWVVAHRTVWAALSLWLVACALRLPLPRAPRVWGAFLVMGCLNNVIPFLLMAWGQQHIETGLTSILNAGTALWGVLLAALVFADERLTARRAAGVTLGLAGVALAVGPGALRGLDLTSLAQLAVIAGTVSYAVAAIWARKRLSGLPPILAAAGMLSGAALVSLPLAVALEGPPDLTLAPRTLGSIAYFALVATAGAYLLYYRVLAMAGSGNLMLVTLMIPPTAILLGTLVLGETLEPTAYGGFALLALGLAVLDGRLFRLFRWASPAP
ncbi:DMT family transporter [Histidinibacterium lentulum]|uniref:DMT family transporter n=1 Tax=Histidinibacterium lentulum TaxID=2480588 RepID=A0A3N2R9U0_9RHOB|nr:DMT family transporter [Histidinibacterium lentulum]ROU04185.1 DMT family transporter [Histidinibacterium lentulum]